MSDSPNSNQGTIVPTREIEVDGARVPAVDACWQSIGVYGRGDCPQLKEFIHCRNCPVYSNAAQRLLDRPLPHEYRREWAVHFSSKQDSARPAKTSAVLFRINAEWLALPAQVFQEVAEHRSIHSVPHRRMGIVVGLANIRGELLICVSLARLLGLETLAGNKHPGPPSDRLLVTQWQASRLVFPVHEVHGIHRFEAS